MTRDLLGTLMILLQCWCVLCWPLFKKMSSSPASKKAAGIANIEVAERRLMLVEEVLLVKLFLNFLWRILVGR